MADTSLLATARRGDLPLVREILERLVRRFGVGAGQMSEGDQLLDEALTYARLGDLGETTHRLRLRSEPKWHDVRDCQRQYDQAIREKRAREAV